MRIVTINDKDHSVLLTPAKTIEFPLKPEIRQQIEQMRQFVIDLDEEHGIAGLAAPQVGLGLRMIFIQLKADWKQYRNNVVGDVMPLTPLLNPSYQPIEADGMNKDFEACFSVPDIAAEVDRYNAIHYQWQDLQGQQHQAIAKGFLARLIQHETDHTDGILHTSLVQDSDQVITIEEILAERERRKANSDLRQEC